MKDVTKDIKNAISQDVLWRTSIFFEYTQLLRKNEFEISYWEGEENWATISISNSPVGYLWRKYPVLFIVDKYQTQVVEISSSYGFVSIIFARDLNLKAFKLDYQALVDYLDYGANYEKFSATDLWFHTNSI